MQNGMYGPKPVGAPNPVAEGAMRAADRRTPQPEPDQAMQAIAAVRNMAERDPQFMQELVRMVDEMKAQYQEQPRRGYAARM
jgi:hypothetical protein